MSLVWKNFTHRALTSTPSNTLRWTGTEIANLAFSSNISAWPHKCSAGWMGKNPHRNTTTFCGKPSLSSGSHYSCKMVTNPILMSMYLDCNVFKVPVSLMQYFVHTVLRLLGKVNLHLYSKSSSVHFQETKHVCTLQYVYDALKCCLRRQPTSFATHPLFSIRHKKPVLWNEQKNKKKKNLSLY